MTTEILSLEVSEDGSRIVKRSIEKVAEASNKADKSVVKLQNDLKKFKNQINPINQLKQALAGIGGFLALGNAFNEALRFGTAMSEVSTLVDETAFNMNKLTEAAKEQAVQFGSQPVNQSKALYQIISAGASDSADAIETLTAANKLAVGGVTDVFIAADGLTTVLNAYGDKAGNAASVSDTLFVGMRAGKTTIEELSSSLGKVVPLAENLDVSFEELVASTAALTKGGISTRESVTGIRAVLAAIAKPSKEAAELSKELGIQFNIAGIQSRGLAGFMQHLAERTGGSKNAMTKLFGGVEALIPIMALAGKAGDSFNEIMDDMAVKSGETEKALKKITDGEGFKYNRFLSLSKTLMISLGDAIAAVLIPVLDLLVNRFDDVALAAGVFLGIMSIAKIKAISAAVLGLTGRVVALTVAMASNPFGLLAVGIAAVISSLVFFRNQIKLGADKILTLRDFSVAAFDLIREKLTPLTDSIKKNFAIASTIAQAAMASIPFSFNDVLKAMKDFINQLIGAFLAGFGAISDLVKITFKNIKALATGGDAIGIEQMLDIVSKNAKETFEKDYIGNFVNNIKTGFDEVEKRAKELKKLRSDLEKNLQPSDSSSGSTGSKIKDPIKEAVDPEVKASIDAIKRSIMEENELLKMTSISARDLKATLLSIQDELEGKGILLSEKEIQDNFEGLLKINQQLIHRANILDSIKGPQEDFKNQAQALSDLIQSGNLQGQVAQATISLGGLVDFEGTQLQLDSYVEQHKLAFDQIKTLRDNQLIDEDTANQLRAKADAKLSEQRLQNASKFFGGLASLSSSENKKLAAIGKAAAITQATIQGVVAVQNALAVQPYPVGVALAAAAAVTAASNIAKISTTRRLGGDLNAGQMSRVGEGTRPEIFRNSLTGEQFFIPPERGTVDPVRAKKQKREDGVDVNSGQNAQNSIRVVNVLDREIVGDFLSSAEGEQVLLNIMRDNADGLRQVIGQG